MTHVVLKHLNEPLRVLSCSFQDLMLYAAPFFIGALVDDMLVIPLVGMAIVVVLKRFMRRLPRYYCIRWLYWSIPTQAFNKIFRADLPPSHVRIWVR